MKHVWVAVDPAGNIDPNYWFRFRADAIAFCGSRSKVYPHMVTLKPRRMIMYYQTNDSYSGNIRVIRNPLMTSSYDRALFNGAQWGHPSWMITKKPLLLYDHTR